MKNVLILMALFLGFNFCFLSKAQAQLAMPMDTIAKGANNGYPLTFQGETLTMPRLGEIFASNPAASAEFDAAKTNQTFGMILGYAGGFMIGWPLGTAIGGGEPNWLLAGIGVGLVAVAIPLGSATKKRTMNAVDIYNAGIMEKEVSQLQLNIGGSRDGLGLILKF